VDIREEEEEVVDILEEEEAVVDILEEEAVEDTLEGEVLGVNNF